MNSFSIFQYSGCVSWPWHPKGSTWCCCPLPALCFRLGLPEADVRSLMEQEQDSRPVGNPANPLGHYVGSQCFMFLYVFCFWYPCNWIHWAKQAEDHLRQVLEDHFEGQPQTNSETVPAESQPSHMQASSGFVWKPGPVKNSSFMKRAFVDSPSIQDPTMCKGYLQRTTANRSPNSLAQTFWILDAGQAMPLQYLWLLRGRIRKWEEVQCGASDYPKGTPNQDFLLSLFASFCEWASPPEYIFSGEKYIYRFIYRYL